MYMHTYCFRKKKNYQISPKQRCIIGIFLFEVKTNTSCRKQIFNLVPPEDGFHDIRHKQKIAQKASTRFNSVKISSKFIVLLL